MTYQIRDQFRELLPRQRNFALRCATAIHVLQALYHRLATAHALTFFAVSAEEGLPVSVLARRCGVKPSIVSLHLRRLTSRVIKGETGFDLLTVADRHTFADFRLRHVFLTERGHRLAVRMEEVMKDNPLKLVGPMADLMFEDEVQRFVRQEEARGTLRAVPETKSSEKLPPLVSK